MDDKSDRVFAARKLGSVLGQSVLAFACLLPIVYALFALFKSPVHYVELVAEDNIGETITAICFLAAGMIALFAAYRRRRAGEPWAVLALFGLVTLFIGGEEVSWFSRIFGYSARFIEDANRQDEVNVHNLFWRFGRIEAVIGPIGLLSYGLVLPLAARLSSAVEAFTRRWGVPFPPWQAVPLFVAAAIFIVAETFNLQKGNEIAEMASGFGMLVTAATFGHPPALETDLRALRAVALTLLAALLIVQFGPAGYATQQRERRLSEFRDWRYQDMSLPDQTRRLIEYDESRARNAALLGNSGVASHNRRLFLSESSAPERLKALADLGEAKARTNLALALINASIALHYAGKVDEAQKRLDEATELVDQELAQHPQTSNLIVLRATVICLKEGRPQALNVLESGRARRSLGAFERTKVLKFIEQGHCRR